MNNRKIRIKFIKIASVSVVFVIILLVSTVNLFATYHTNKFFDSVLIRMIENGGSIPPNDITSGGKMGNPYFDDGGTLRSFAIEISPIGEATLASGNIPEDMDISQIDFDGVIKMKHKTSGRLGDYRYYVDEYEGQTMVAFGNYIQEEWIMTLYLESSLWISAIAMILLLILMYYFSGKAVSPIVESAKRQKSFISNAGHELKTPLAIISANAEMLELESDGENEWVVNIQNQTKRMAILVDNLLRLSSMGEGNLPSLQEPFSLSELVGEISDSFKVVADRKHCVIDTDITYDLSLNGDEKMIRELLMILCDNAIKYATPKSTININLSKQISKVIFTIKNDIEEENTPDTDKLFDGFYRADSSRARESGGYGLGLSIAKSVALLHRGSIKADIIKSGENAIIFTVSI